MSEPTDRDDGPEVHPFARRFRFVDAPGLRRSLWIVLGVITVGLVLLDLVVQRHSSFAAGEGSQAMDARFGFYAFAGFATIGVVVVLVAGLKHLLIRPETYYSESDKNA